MSTKFPCGCSFPSLGEFTDFRIDDIPDDCSLTWELLASGRTLGVFQLDSPLGQRWSKRLRPESIENIAALTAILRPGSLHALDADGVSMTEHFCRRKNGEEEVKPYHSVVDEILGVTYGTIAFQEQLLMLARDLAGFDLIELYQLQKAVSKKLEDKLAEVLELFIKKGEEKGVASPEQLREVANWIRASGRYSFVKAHATGYGKQGYRTAYMKAHFPRLFFTSWLACAKDGPEPRETMSKFIQDARTFGIEVKPPTVQKKDLKFWTDNQHIYFGLGSIKGVGGEVGRVLMGELEKADVSSWEGLLRTSRLTKEVLGLLAQSGSLDCYGKTRTRLLNEIGIWHTLTKPETEWLRSNSWGNLPEGLDLLSRPKSEGGGVHTEGRGTKVKGFARVLREPLAPEADLPHWVLAEEERLLGIALTVSRLDNLDLPADSTCLEFLRGRGGWMTLGVEIKKCRETLTKKGDPMAYLTVSDLTCQLDNVVVFKEGLAKYKTALQPGRIVLLRGSRSNFGSFVVQEVIPHKVGSEE